jgi:hypothetical protein
MRLSRRSARSAAFSRLGLGATVLEPLAQVFHDCIERGQVDPDIDPLLQQTQGAIQETHFVEGFLEVLGSPERSQGLVPVLGAAIEPGDDDDRNGSLGVLDDALGQIEAVQLRQDGLQNDEAGLVQLLFFPGR